MRVTVPYTQQRACLPRPCSMSTALQADAAGPQVPIAAQTAVGLVPGVPGSADATGPQVLCSTDHRGSFARRARFSRCRRSSGPYCSTDPVGLVPGVPGSVDATGPQVPIAAQTAVGLVLGGQVSGPCYRTWVPDHPPSPGTAAGTAADA